MMWLAWRQQRLQILLTAGVLAVLAVALAVFRYDMVSFIDAHHLAGCWTPSSTSTNAATCESTALQQFQDHYQPVVSLLQRGLVFVPILLGLFWGTPLFARELEARTHILAWTQSVSRQRWLATKLAVALAATLVTAGVLDLLHAWVAKPFTTVLGSAPLSPTEFTTSGLVPLATMLLTITLGATLGLLVRRTVPAMALTLAITAAAFLAIGGADSSGMSGLRAHYMTPQYRMTPLASLHTDNPYFRLSPSGLWAGEVDKGWIDASGQHSPITYWPCIDGIHHDGTTTVQDQDGTAFPDLETCYRKYDIVGRYVAYQPADRYWTFQLIESALLLTLSLGLTGLATWRIRRRLA